MSAASGKDHERIGFIGQIGPGHRNADQVALLVMETGVLPRPVTSQLDQFPLPAAERMERMADPEPPCQVGRKPCSPSCLVSPANSAASASNAPRPPPVRCLPHSRLHRADAASAGAR